MTAARGLAFAGLIACALVALGGSYVGVRAFASDVEAVSLGTMRVEVEPAIDGRIDVYVPIVDWGVRAEAFEAPVTVNLRFRSLNRIAARRTLRSGREARAALERIRSELADAVRSALVAAAAVAMLGGIAGGALAGGLVGALVRRRRWIGYGAATGAAVCGLFTLVTLIQVSRLDYGAFQRPTFYAHGRELPRLLAFSEQLPDASGRYTKAYEQAVAGLANLVAFAGAGEAATTGRTILVASDLHSNALVLPVLAQYGEGKPLFFVGDFTLLGTSDEGRFAEEIAALGNPVVAVSGNHDSRPFMRALARAGATVLTREGRLRPDGTIAPEVVVEVADLTVAGYDDPLEGEHARVTSRPLELSDEERERAEADFVAWFEALKPQPEIVLVHQHALAHALLDAQSALGGPPLVILTGHDHHQHIHARGGALLVDGGTVGAGGPLAIGEQPVGFAQLHLDTFNTRIDALDLIDVEPLSGEAVARRLVPPFSRE